MKKGKIIGPVYCASAALIWGLSFVFQKTGADIGTFTFNGIRTFIGGLALIPVIIFMQIKKNRGVPKDKKSKIDYKSVLRGGGVCGVVLCIAGNLQQQAFTYDIEAGKVAFITALYMILVPIFGLFRKKMPAANVWAGVVLGITGLYFICMKKGDFGIGKGEIFALLCAVGFAVHIIVIDKYCKEVDNICLSCAQYLIAGGISLICMFIFEEPKISDILGCSVNILYAGIGSCTFAFTFQIFGQKYTEPTVASLLMCLESVFAVIFGWIILHDNLGARALIGCVIMFAGVICSQLPLDSILHKKYGMRKLND